MPKEYQVRVEIQESKDGHPLPMGKRFYKTVWVTIDEPDLDYPYDALKAATETAYGDDWTMGK